MKQIIDNTTTSNAPIKRKLKRGNYVEKYEKEVMKKRIDLEFFRSFTSFSRSFSMERALVFCSFCSFSSSTKGSFSEDSSPLSLFSVVALLFVPVLLNQRLLSLLRWNNTCGGILAAIGIDRLRIAGNSWTSWRRSIHEALKRSVLASDLDIALVAMVFSRGSSRFAVPCGWRLRCGDVERGKLTNIQTIISTQTLSETRLLNTGKHGLSTGTVELR